MDRLTARWIVGAGGEAVPVRVARAYTELATVESRSKAAEKGWIGRAGASAEDGAKVSQMSLEALLGSFAAESDPRLPPFHQDGRAR